MDTTSDLQDPAAENRAPGRRILLVAAMARHETQSLQRLAQAGFELVEGYSLGPSPTPAALGRALEGIWGTVAGSEPYTREVLTAATDLRAIARCGVGYDAVDVAAATDRGIAVLITPNGNFDSVADFALTLMLACLRQLLQNDRRVREGGWRAARLSGDLSGATVGVVGLGRIGRAVARRLQGFNCRILGVDPFPDLAACARLGVELMSLDEMLPQVDVLTLHTPRLPDTLGLIGARQLARMKPTAVLINTSRGAIVDEMALDHALRSGALAAAALDVFEQEPLRPDHPLLTCPNLIVTGHVSSFTRLAAQNTIVEVVDNLLAVAAGEIPEGFVNPAALGAARARGA
ncbi:MAG: phosphoglycerate dehydrogenase [Chloroflexi bacterium]|nr:phosphoglycerate dehydrogenase [Chloroflexota bacterium]